MYLSQMSLENSQQEQALQQQHADPYSVATLQQQQQQVLANQQAALYGSLSNEVYSNGTLDIPQQHGGHSSSLSQGTNGLSLSSGATTIGGLLAPARNPAHARAVSLPAFSQEALNNGTQAQQPQQQSQTYLGAQQSYQQSHRPQASMSGFGSFGGSTWGLNGWAEESAGAQ